VNFLRSPGSIVAWAIWIGPHSAGLAALAGGVCAAAHAIASTASTRLAIMHAIA
jgi:hypothetical protein